MAIIPIVAGVAILGALVAASSGATSGVSAGAGEYPTGTGYEDLRAVMDAAQLPADWQVFLAATALRESGWHTDVGLGPNDAPGRPPWMRASRASWAAQDNEASAAGKAYDKNVGLFAGSPYPRSRYAFGSGGWFGFLPAYGIISGFKQSPKMIAQIDPWAVCHPLVSVVMAVGFARGLMGWRQFDEGGGTWFALRIGWGKPGKMAQTASSPKTRASFAGHLATVGAAPSFMDRRPSPLTGPTGAALLQLLEGREREAEAAMAMIEGGT
jgi:hypothetical protein